MKRALEGINQQLKQLKNRKYDFITNLEVTQNEAKYYKEQIKDLDEQIDELEAVKSLMKHHNLMP